MCTRRPAGGLCEKSGTASRRWTITVTTCGRICIGGRKINLSQVFAGQNVGIKEVVEKICVTGMDQARNGGQGRNRTNDTRIFRRPQQPSSRTERQRTKV